MRTLSDMKVKGATEMTYVHGIGKDRNTCMTTALMTEGHSGTADHTGEEGRVLHMGLGEVKGPAMPGVRAVRMNAAVANMDMAMVLMHAASEAAGCVVATCARAPGVMMHLVLR